MTETTQQKYELMLLLPPNLTNDEMKEEIKKIKESIASLKGEIFLEDHWGIQECAYRIRSYEKGLYIILYCNFDPEKARELDSILRLEKNILRYLFIKIPQEYTPKKMELTLPVRRGAREMAYQQNRRANAIKPEEKEEKTASIPKSLKKKAAPSSKKPEIVAPAIEEIEPISEITEPKTPEEIFDEEPAAEIPKLVVKSQEKRKEPSLEDLDSIDKKLESIIADPNIDLK